MNNDDSIVEETLALNLLRVASDKCVLNLCAKPGTLAKRLMDYMHLPLQASEVPQGILVQNAVDVKDRHLLQLQSASSARSVAVFTCCAPNRFPALQTVVDEHGYAIWMPPSRRDPAGQFILKFSHILCCVPCTHAVTTKVALSKSIPVAKILAMHRSQVKILEHGLRLLAPGGRLAYRTYSTHPIENEAVVSAALLAFGCDSGIELAADMDKSTMPKHTEGLDFWHVPKPETSVHESDVEHLETFASIDEVPLKLSGNKVHTSMFPPCGDQGNAPWARAQLKRCLRIHPANSRSGSFIAIFIKKDIAPLGKLLMESRASSDSKENSVCPLGDLHEGSPSIEIKSGTHVQVRTTGAPAVVIGPGKKTYEGLIKIRYPDRCTYHLPMGELRIVVPTPKSKNPIQHLVQSAQTDVGSMRIKAVIGLLFVIVLNPRRQRWQRWLAFLLALVVSASSRLRRPRSELDVDSTPQMPEKHDARDARVPGSRLVHAFVGIPPALDEFKEFFGLQLDSATALRFGVSPFPFSSVCYRTDDKLNLYLASDALLGLRVPAQFRGVQCGMPLLTRCSSPKERLYWGSSLSCEVRPLPEAAPLLARCASRRRLSLCRAAFVDLLRTRKLCLEALRQLEIDGHASGLESCDEAGEFIRGGVVVVLWDVRSEGSGKLVALVGVLGVTCLEVPKISEEHMMLVEKAMMDAEGCEQKSSQRNPWTLGVKHTHIHSRR